MDSGSGHSKQSDDNVHFKCVFGLETKDEVVKKFRNCLEPLRENQIQVDTFTVSNMINLGYTIKRMVKHVRVLTTIPFKEVRDSVLIRANSLGFCPLDPKMINLRHIAEVCRWMKTKSGIEALVEVQRSEKLKRRAAAKGITLVEECMIRAINAQFAEYSDKVKEVDSKILLELSVIRDKYWPASVFHVSNILSEESVLDFCRKDQEVVKRKLMEYVKGLIDSEKIYPQRKVEVLRAVLEGMNDNDGEDHVQASRDGENSNLNGKFCVGKKRKSSAVLDHDGESLSKIRSHK